MLWISLVELRHINDLARASPIDSELLKSRYYFSSEHSVKRSLYIDNYLYTISDKKIKMDNLTDLTAVNEIELP